MRNTLGDGDPAAWRAALRVLEYAWGKPKEELTLELDTVENPLDVARMPRERRDALVRRLSAEHPDLAARLLGPKPVTKRPISGRTSVSDAPVPR